MVLRIEKTANRCLSVDHQLRTERVEQREENITEGLHVIVSRPAVNWAQGS